VFDIKGIIRRAEELDMQINIYLEDWSNGMINSEDYVFYMTDNLKDEKIARFMLPDTLGILNPDQTYTFCKKMIDRYPSLHFDFHPHNDYDLAVANVFSAVRAGVKGVHTTINGLGERAGNAPLSSVVGVLHDQLKAETGIDEYEITKASKIVETFSGIRIPVNKPVIGENVSPRLQEFMLTATPRTTSIIIISFPKGLEEKGNMLWVNNRVRPQ
jgi:D-citramalate synthase